MVEMLNLFLVIVKKTLSKVGGDDRLNVSSGCNGGRLKLLNVGGGGCGGSKMKLLNDGGGGAGGCSGGIKLLTLVVLITVIKNCFYCCY